MGCGPSSSREPENLEDVRNARRAQSAPAGKKGTGEPVDLARQGHKSAAKAARDYERVRRRSGGGNDWMGE